MNDDPLVRVLPAAGTTRAQLTEAGAASLGLAALARIETAASTALVLAALHSHRTAGGEDAPAARRGAVARGEAFLEHFDRRTPLVPHRLGLGLDWGAAGRLLLQRAPLLLGGAGGSASGGEGGEDSRGCEWNPLYGLRPPRQASRTRSQPTGRVAVAEPSAVVGTPPVAAAGSDCGCPRQNCPHCSLLFPACLQAEHADLCAGRRPCPNHCQAMVAPAALPAHFLECCKYECVCPACHQSFSRGALQGLCWEGGGGGGRGGGAALGIDGMGWDGHCMPQPRMRLLQRIILLCMISRAGWSGQCSVR